MKAVIIRNLRMLNSLLVFLGFDLVKFCRILKAIPFFLIDLYRFQSELNRKQVKNFSVTKLYPCLNDFQSVIAWGGHYFYQDLLVAQKIFLNNPQRHVDIGSSIYGLVTHVASFREIEVFDIKDIKINMKNIKATQLDLMSELDHSMKNYCDSISSLHVIEHFGLGRYGDNINVDGHLIGIDNIYKLLKPSGKFYFSVPMGIQRIEFNAHRVFSLRYLLKLLGSKFTLNNFSYVDDSDILHENVKILEEDIERNYEFRYGLGIFELTKHNMT